MAINFDALPTERERSVVAPGTYKFEITKAEMKEPWNGEGSDYLGLSLKLTTLDGKMAGFINDKIVENPKPSVAYKIQRLIRAVDLDISGEIELDDLAKLMVGAKGFVDVTNFRPEGSDSDLAIVDLFSYDCYYKKNERAVIESRDKDKKETLTVEDIVEDDEY